MERPTRRRSGGTASASGRTASTTSGRSPATSRLPIFRPLLKRYALRRRDCPRKGTVPGNAATLGRVLGTVARWQSLLASEHPLVADPPGEAVGVETLQQQLRCAA